MLRAAGAGVKIQFGWLSRAQQRRIGQVAIEWLSCGSADRTINHSSAPSLSFAAAGVRDARRGAVARWPPGGTSPICHSLPKTPRLHQPEMIANWCHIRNQLTPRTQTAHARSLFLIRCWPNAPDECRRGIQDAWARLLYFWPRPWLTVTELTFLEISVI